MAKPAVLAPRLEAAFRRYTGITLSRRWLAEHVWGGAIAADSRAIDMLVGDVRKTLPKGERIETVRGAGYRLSTRGKEQGT